MHIVCLLSLFDSCNVEAALSTIRNLKHRSKTNYLSINQSAEMIKSDKSISKYGCMLESAPLIRSPLRLHISACL